MDRIVDSDLANHQTVWAQKQGPGCCSPDVYLLEEHHKGMLLMWRVIFFRKNPIIIEHLLFVLR